MAKFVTFYSYKGGAGRSMALANVAWLLASNGKKVMVIDWDLEAPGLHRYFGPLLPDREMTSTNGLIDFLIDFAVQAMTPERGETDRNWYTKFADIRNYATSIRWSFRDQGTVDLVSAGKQGPSYATRVNSFSWQSFYEKLGGGGFLEEMKKQLAGYDYVLLDSRTGVSDTSGICTIQMPDTLVICFTLNNQSIEGAAAVASSVRAARKEGRGIRIIPIPMRVEQGEKEKLKRMRELALTRFSQVLGEKVEIPDSNQPKLLAFVRETRKRPIAEVLLDVEVPYQPYYAYEEVLATVADQPGIRTSVLTSMERLADYITDHDVVKLQDPPTVEQRQDLLNRYEKVSTRPSPEPAAPQGMPRWRKWLIASGVAAAVLLALLLFPSSPTPPAPYSEVGKLSAQSNAVPAAIFGSAPNDCILASGQTVQLWNCQEQKLVRDWKLELTPTSLALSPDGSSLLVGTAEGELELISILDGQVKADSVFSADSKKTSITGVFFLGNKIPAAFGPSGLGLSFRGQPVVVPWLTSPCAGDDRGTTFACLSTSPGNTITVHSFADKGLVVNGAFRPDALVTALRFDPSSGNLAVASGGQIVIYDPKTWLPTRQLVIAPEAGAGPSGASGPSGTGGASRSGASPIMSLAYSPDGSLIAATSLDAFVYLWNAKTGEFLKKLSGHTGIVYTAAFSPDGSRLITASADQTARIWLMPKLPQPVQTGGK